VVYDSREWDSQARCANIENPEIFFPPRDKTKYKKIALQAKSYCMGPTGNSPCPVRLECLWYAVKDHEINEDEKHGIWGGLSHRERNALIRKWQKLYKKQMTLKEYIFQLDKKENHVSTKDRSTEVLGRQEGPNSPTR
jgi:hypothetical protein